MTGRSYAGVCVIDKPVLWSRITDNEKINMYMYEILLDKLIAYMSRLQINGSLRILYPISPTYHILHVGDKIILLCFT